MSAYFADTSALAKRYLKEVGSMWVISWILPAIGNTIVVAETVDIEMYSLLARRQREGTLPPPNTALLQAIFLLHVEKEYLVAPLDDAIHVHARRLVNIYPLRALDAIQLASAIQAVNILSEPMTFVSADKNLLSAASAEGFTVDDPNAHP